MTQNKIEDQYRLHQQMMRDLKKIDCDICDVDLSIEEFEDYHRSTDFNKDERHNIKRTLDSIKHFIKNIEKRVL
jgi:chromosome segregation ATPase